MVFFYKRSNVRTRGASTEYATALISVIHYDFMFSACLASELPVLICAPTVRESSNLQTLKIKA